MNSFQNTLDNLKQAQTLVEDASQMVYQKIVQETENQKKINIAELIKLENYNAYLFQWLQPLGFTAWNDIYALVMAQSGKQIYSENYILLKDRDYLFVFKKQQATNLETYFIEKEQLEVKIPLKISICKPTNISILSNTTIFVDEEKLIFPLIIRKWQEGDVFYPSGMNGK